MSETTLEQAIAQALKEAREALRSYDVSAETLVKARVPQLVLTIDCLVRMLEACRGQRNEWASTNGIAAAADIPELLSNEDAELLRIWNEGKV